MELTETGSFGRGRRGGEGVDEKNRFNARSVSRSAVLRMSSNVQSVDSVMMFLSTDSLESIDWRVSPEVVVSDHFVIGSRWK